MLTFVLDPLVPVEPVTHVSDDELIANLDLGGAAIHAQNIVVIAKRNKLPRRLERLGESNPLALLGVNVGDFGPPKPGVGDIQQKSR